MTSRVPAPAVRLAPDAGPPPFTSILCGVNAGRPAQEAVREAVALAAGGATLRFLAVADEIGVGATRTALLSPHRADLALEEARHVATDAGVEATSERIDDAQALKRLLEEAQAYDLLVVGSPIHSRTPGMLLGETAGVALHRAEVPVLLARPSGGGVQFPARVVVATDATPASRGAVATGARIAQRHGVPLMLVHVTDRGSADERHEVALQATTAEEITGSDPVVLVEPGSPVPVILDVAGDHDGTVVVMGSSGRTGLDALGSVSERVGARATGPVLVLRPRAAR